MGDDTAKPPQDAARSRRKRRFPRVGEYRRNLTLLVAPAYSSGLMLLPMALGGIPLMLWLLVRGVDKKSIPL